MCTISLSLYIYTYMYVILKFYPFTQYTLLGIVYTAIHKYHSPTLNSEDWLT